MTVGLWPANVTLIASMFLLGRKTPKWVTLGWMINLYANTNWLIYTGFYLRRADMVFLSVAFTSMAIYNLIGRFRK